MKSIADIKAIREKMQSEIIIRDNNDSSSETKIVIGMATCGINAGARSVFNTILEDVATRQLRHVKVVRSGCMGKCDLEPIVEISIPGKETVTYVKVDEEKAKKIVADHVVGGNIVKEYLK